jgi:hypothetical protein
LYRLTKVSYNNVSHTKLLNIYGLVCHQVKNSFAKNIFLAIQVVFS